MIYFQFAKLMGGQGPKPFFEPGAPPSSLLKPPNFLGSHPLFQGLEGFSRPPASAGDFHQALSLYHEELARLQQSAMASAIKDGAEQRRLASATPTDSEAGDRDTEARPAPCLTPPALPLKLGGAPHKSPFLPGPPEAAQEVSGPGPATPGTGSPLQRMASITNSLMTSPPSVSFGNPSANRNRNPLPPITQQQFDR